MKVIYRITVSSTTIEKLYYIKYNKKLSRVHLIWNINKMETKGNYE